MLDTVCTIIYHPVVGNHNINFMLLIIQVPKGHVWLEGDNKTSSYDSRDFGPLPYALIHSRVFYRVSDLSLWLMICRGAEFLHINRDSQSLLAQFIMALSCLVKCYTSH